MAKQTINQGTSPTGAGGDTFRSGSAKLQANDNELYAALGANASGALPSALPVNKGGTGATTASSARTALGLEKTVGANDKTTGRVMTVGDYGLGGTAISVAVDDVSIPSDQQSCLILKGTSSDAAFGAGLGVRVGSSYRTMYFGSTSSIVSNKRIVYVGIPDVTKTAEQQKTEAIILEMLHSGNTTTDSNGFIKAASPIVELYADRIELNEEAKQQNITFEKLGIGDYIIKGSSGLAQSGWYVEQPKDANGNVYHAVIYDTLENGDISIKTYEQKLDGVKIVADLDKPVDIKENRFISIRLQELPQEPIEAPQPDPTITDYQGNPAPSHLHELVDGTWTISSENAAILENERLAAMPALTRRQFRLALAMNGYNLADIETLINSIEDPMQRQITMIEWQDATTFERLNPSLLAMADLMGLVAEQVNMLWNQALTL